jgi:polyvinyl alcohol dehydrogenase (cytochrome)
MKASHDVQTYVVSALVVLFGVAGNPVIASAQNKPYTTLPSSALCHDAAAVSGEAITKPHWNGWGADSSQRRFQPAEMARLAPSDVSKLKLKWAFGLPAVRAAVAQPTVMGGRIFIGTQAGKIYSLDANSGCVFWEFDAGAAVRSAMTIGQDSRGWSIYFGDAHADAYAMDAQTGKLLWKTHVEDHAAAKITGAPTLTGTTLFVPVSSKEELTGSDPKYQCCSFRGSLVALEASTGRILWKSYMISDEAKAGEKNEVGVQMMGPSGAGIWSSPTVDVANGLVYVTTGDNYSDPATDSSDAIIALRMDSGEIAWSRQIISGDAYNMACGSRAPTNCPKAKGPDYDFGSSAILVDLANAKRALVGAQKSGVVTALDPDRSGQTLWQKRVGRGGVLGGIEWGAAADTNNVYVAVSDVLPQVVPDGTPGSQKSFFGPSFLLDSKTGGGLYALKLESGEQVWHTPHPGCNEVPGCSPAQSAAVTVIPGTVFSGGLDGHLRAYSAVDGRIIWDVDTTGDYQTVDGVAAHGGSINGPGPVVVDGVVYVNSGYGFVGTMPGNVLLAYSVDGR